jgi:hypothetical protein
MTAAQPPLKLRKLPDRAPVKLTIQLDPALHATLQMYVAVYRDVYGADEPLSELIPHMLKSFLDSDRSFARARLARANEPKGE